MSSSLERDYEDEFQFSSENQLEKADVDEHLQNYSIGSLSPLKQLERCEICEQKFETKKDLQSHVLVHLGKPRVVLKRISNVKAVPKEQTEKYCLETEHKGNLKITLKRQSPVHDSLKLKLKKSPVSESFTVVSNNFNFEKKETKEEDELADPQENDTKSDSEEEKTEQSFENVILNQEASYDDDNFESEPDQNPLENFERPTMDNNEGDSGVGSDFVNPLEREDQNEDDLQADNNSNSDQAEVADTEAEADAEAQVEAEVEDEIQGEGEPEEHEESDALEATCRETIENLKKLGEHSRYISSRSSDLLNPNETPQEIAVEEEDEEKEEDNPVHRIEGLRANSEISIVPKSALMPVPSTNASKKGAETEIVPIGGGSSISWTRITEDSNSSSKSRRESRESIEKDTPDNTENARSLLQSFLLEQQQQRNQNESNNVQVLETEYVSLERLAETVNTCRVCNEKFKDIAHLDAHRSKAGHYQCNIPDCSSLVFTTPKEVSFHKVQAHGAPSVSPNLRNLSPHQNSPHSHSPHLNQVSSPHLNTHSPHSPSIPTAHNSPLNSPHTNSPTYQTTSYPPVNLDQLPAPVQQLAQQVQRMPLPQPPPNLPPGPNTLIPGVNYYPQPGRPPLYRVQAPPQYPPHLAHLYQQYNASPYQQLGMQPQMQYPLHQQPRARYPAVMPGQRAPRMSQPPVPPPAPASVQMARQARMKRPMPPQPGQQHSQQTSPVVSKQRRMDVLLPDRNEDADCHVIAQQKRNDGLPVIQNVQGGASVTQTSRNDSTIHLTDSITLSVRQPAQVNAMVQNSKKPDASAVANVLAARGITVTPASKKSQEQTNQSSQSPQQQQQKQQPSVLNLNSAISIIPASSQKKQQEQQGQFAIPQNKQVKQVTSDVERPPRPPTVDLTQDTPFQPIVRRGRPPRMLQSLTCQVCDKRFQSQELLSQHMLSHRTTNKLLHKCELCLAQYPTLQALNVHKRSYHKELETTSHINNNIELALPVVDLKAPNTVSRLSNLGITSYIPLSQLSAQTGGYFGLPIVTIDGARNPSVCNLGALGATSILSLGPLKHLQNNR